MGITTGSQNFQVTLRELIQPFNELNEANNLQFILHFFFKCIQDTRNKKTAGPSSINSFSDEEEDTRQMLSISKSAQGRGGNRKRGRGRSSSNLKQMTLDVTMRTRNSQRSFSESILDDVIYKIKPRVEKEVKSSSVCLLLQSFYAMYLYMRHLLRSICDACHFPQHHKCSG